MEDNKILQEILETVNFLKDNSVSKQEFSSFRQEVVNNFSSVDNRFTSIEGDFSSFRQEVKYGFKQVEEDFEKVYEEFQKVREEIISHVDGFITLHQRLESELAAAYHKINRLEIQIQTIAKHLDLKV